MNLFLAMQYMKYEKKCCIRLKNWKYCLVKSKFKMFFLTPYNKWSFKVINTFFIIELKNY